MLLKGLNHVAVITNDATRLNDFYREVIFTGIRSQLVLMSLEPGEEWSWCFVDEVALLIRGIQGETRIPPSPLG